MVRWDTNRYVLLSSSQPLFRGGEEPTHGLESRVFTRLTAPARGVVGNAKRDPSIGSGPFFVEAGGAYAFARVGIDGAPMC
jgi:hypothetical protein